MKSTFAIHILALVAFVAAQRRAKPPALSAIDETRYYVTKRFEGFWADLFESNDVGESPVQDLELLRKFEGLNANLTDVFIDRSGFYYVSSVWAFAQVEAQINNVDGYFETFLRFQREQLGPGGKRKPVLAWSDLAETYLQTSDIGLLNTLQKLHKYAAVPMDGHTMYQKVLQDLTSNTCNLQQSPQALLYNLYNTVALAELKGYTLLQFSYMLLRLYNKGNFTLESQLVKSKYEERSIEEVNAVRAAMQNADRSVFNCDPKQFVEGVNYVKLTKLLQGYIENEINLNKYGTCRENCAYYYYTDYTGCYMDQFCGRQKKCNGKVVECRYIDSDMNICKSSDPERRYDWVEYENGRVLGTKGTCENKNLYKVDSWWRYLFWHCSYCFCYCDETQSDSDRYFSLREVQSSAEDNKVVTGVRIVKNNQIIHLQIQEGVLTSRAIVDPVTVAWKPVDNFTISDRNAENGVDYHTMTWNERLLDIDDAISPPEHVVTGVRFRKVGVHINLEIRTCPFNFTTGRLAEMNECYWEGNDNTEVSENPRREIRLEDPDIPIRKGPNIVDSRHDQYVKFQATSMDSDAAQNTVPYLDSQVLESKGYPLAGLGFVHRGKRGSGGFIAPKLISYDFAPHLVPVFASQAEPA